MTLKGNEFTSTWHDDPQDIMALWAKFGHTSYAGSVATCWWWEIHLGLK